MKKLFLMFALVCFGAIAADWTGYIIDKNCASKKAMLGNEACAKKCITGGAPAVLATEDGKIYPIANQDKVIEHAGHKVTVTGKMEDGTITVESVKM